MHPVTAGVTAPVADGIVCIAAPFGVFASEPFSRVVRKNFQLEILRPGHCGAGISSILSHREGLRLNRRSRTTSNSPLTPHPQHHGRPWW